MKKAIFITVRTNSSRLPQKCLLEINDVKNIEFLINRLKRSKRTDIIVLCTTTNKNDDVLCKIAEDQGISFFRGSEEDKLERWLGAAKQFDVDFFVTADGDDLFCEAELIDLAFKQYEQSQCDFIEEKPGASVPVGAFTYGIKVAALEKVCQIKGTNETEMMAVYFTNSGLFKVEVLKNIPCIFKKKHIRMTLDYQEDFDFFKNVIEHFGGNIFTMRDIIRYLDKNPDVVKINQSRNEDFLKNQAKKTNMVLKKE
jgi:spore coat polysaccharide biosynthesis protein SpsF